MRTYATCSCTGPKLVRFFSRIWPITFLPRILEDTAFLNRLTHGFLVRDPVASIASYHSLDPEVTDEEIGLEGAATLLHDGIKAVTGQAAPVISAEDVRDDPRLA